MLSVRIAPFVLGVVFILGAEASLYAESPFVDEVHPHDLYELVRDQPESVHIVQFYNGSDPDADAFVSNYSIAAKSMVGYARSTAINVENHLFTNLVMKISKTPTYVYYGYYKHLPDRVRTLVTVDDIHEETSKQLVRFFEERSVYRLIHDKRNMEMGTGDLDFRLMTSRAPWMIVYYKRDHPTSEGIADVWKELVALFHERVQFGSVNNPLYRALNISDEEYPVIKFFPKGSKQQNKADTYAGELTTERLCAYLDEKIISSEVRPHRVTSAQVVVPCLKKRFCIFLFLPTSPEYQKNGIALLAKECRRHGRHAWAWYWNVYNDQPDIEAAFGISDLGGPHGVIVVVNVQAATFIKRIFDEALTAGVLESIVENIKEDVGFDGHFISRELPDIKRIRIDASREEL